MNSVIEIEANFDPNILFPENWAQDWIGCRRTYRDVPHYVSQAFTQARSIPPTIRDASLPDFGAPVTEFLQYKLETLWLQDSAATLEFCDEPPDKITPDELRRLPIPLRQTISQYNDILAQQWRDGKTALKSKHTGRRYLHTCCQAHFWFRYHQRTL
jgi:hypothetical protein